MSRRGRPAVCGSLSGFGTCGIAQNPFAVQQGNLSSEPSQLARKYDTSGLTSPYSTAKLRKSFTAVSRSNICSHSNSSCLKAASQMFIFDMTGILLIHVVIFGLLWRYGGLLLQVFLPLSFARPAILRGALFLSGICVCVAIATKIYDHLNTPRSGDSGHSFTIPFIVYIVVVYLAFDVYPTVLSIQRNHAPMRLVSLGLNCTIIVATFLSLLSLVLY